VRTSGSLTVDALESRILPAGIMMTDYEQLLLELVNRARANPGAEATRLGIGLNSGLPANTISNTPKQPLAPHQSLIDAAQGHAQDMLDRDYFDHDTNGTMNGPPERAAAAGYPSSSVGENIAWGGTTGVLDQLQAVHDRHRGLFNSPGHRTNMMDPDYEEVGMGVRYGQYTHLGTTYNAIMVVEDFGIRTVNPFITGVVFTDSDSDDFYDVGEAIRSGTVTATNTATGAVYSTMIGNSGGYGILVPAGTYSVTASYSVAGVPQLSSRNVTVGSENLKVDFDSTDPAAVTLSITAPVTALNETGANSAPVFQVSRSGDLGSQITVTLSSGDTSEFTVPATVTIPAGQASVSFTVNAVNDGIIDGLQTSQLAASAPLYAAASVTLSVADRNWPLLPTVAQVVTTARPTFTWTGVANAASYQIYVNNITTNQAAVINQSGIAGTSFVSPVDLTIGDYYVWVRGFTAGNLASVWSPAATWRVRTTTSITGSGRTESTPNFTIAWTPVPGASAYDIWIDRRTSNTSQYLRNTNVAQASLPVTDFAVGQYAIWVRSRNTAGTWTGWGNQGIINVNVPVSGLNATAPDFTSAATLQWNTLGGAVSYDVWIDNRTTGQSQVLRNTSVATTSLSLASLPAGSYRAWVRGRDVKGVLHAWSRHLDFEIGQPPRLLTPTGSANPARPLFTWTTVAGAVRYELVIADDMLLPLITESNLTGNSFSITTDLTPASYRAWIRAFAADGSVTSDSAVITFAVAATGSPESGNAPATGLLIAELVPSLLESTDAHRSGVRGEWRESPEQQDGPVEEVPGRNPSAAITKASRPSPVDDVSAVEFAQFFAASESAPWTI
jgi:hypothetical protein